MNRLILFIAVSALFLTCSRQPAGTAGPLVAVSIPPQKFFVDKIAGGLVDVLVMIPPGASPHSYEPKPAQMAALSSARAYFAIGVEFEKAWLGKLAGIAPGMTIIHTDSGIAKLPMEEGTEHDSAHHEGSDPHIWLSPELVKRQAATIAQALATLFPAHAATFRHRDSLFTSEIGALQDSIRLLLSARKSGQPFLVFHPSWGYFAKEFGLMQIAIEVEGKEPSPAELGAIFDLARRTNVTTIYVQPQFSRRSAEIIAGEIGARVVVADPLAESWHDNLIACARALAQ
jgi:zinc transport system substrate-binding protein